MSKNQYTENQTAVLANYSFKEGRWFDSVAGDLVTLGIIAKKPQAKATLNQLIKKGILSADTTVEEGSTWLEYKVTEDWFGQGEEAPVEEEVETDEEDLLGDVAQDVLEGTPTDEVMEELAVLEAEDIKAEAAEFDAVSEEPVHKVESDNYVELSWTDADDVEWTETKFVDGSRTLKRRKKVSGSWRTDYWGVEFEGDKERYTTAKFAKMARAYGTFTHNPIV